MYCDFYSITEREHQREQFTKMLCREIEQFAAKNEFPFVIDTLFIGGGTPSLLEPYQLESIFKTMRKHYDLTDLKEVTLEANPGEAHFEKLKSFRELGINRLSMGFQSLQPELLIFLTRIHSREQAIETFENARKAGFDTINIDMIFAIPGQTLENWESDLIEIIKLEPNHISAYSLTNEPGTEFNRMVRLGQISEVADEKDLAFLLFTRKFLKDRGYHAYEISNFARKGFECRHNLHYWKTEPYLAFGPSAHGYDGKKRWWNVRSLDEYLNRLQNAKSPIVKSEHITPEKKYNELLLNGLRLPGGVSQIQINSLDINSKSNLSENLIKWKNKLEIKKGYLKITTEGIPFTDSILTDLFV